MATSLCLAAVAPLACHLLDEPSPGVPSAAERWGGPLPDLPALPTVDGASRRAPQPSTAAQLGADGTTPATVTTPELPAEPDRPHCRMPDTPLPTSAGCDTGLPYPACRWRIPHPAVATNLYRRWRNTTLERWWGRPALVSIVLAAAADYARAYPGELLAVGDLDAPGPRHETHDRGVDVDLYLPGMMEADNEGAGAYPDNYVGRPKLSVRMLRGRVEELARILATCTEGRVRIYYNDEVVAKRFHRWYREQGYESSFGAPMQRHNDLHRFHFHVTIPEDLEPLPLETR